MTPQHHQNTTHEKRPGVDGYVMPLLGLPNEWVRAGSQDEHRCDVYVAMPVDGIGCSVWMSDEGRYTVWLYDERASPHRQIKQGEARVRFYERCASMLVSRVYHFANEMKSKPSFTYWG